MFVMEVVYEMKTQKKISIMLEFNFGAFCIKHEVGHISTEWISLKLGLVLHDKCVRACRERVALWD